MLTDRKTAALHVIGGAMALLTASPALALDNLSLPISRVRLGEVVSGQLDGQSAILDGQDGSRPATVIQFPPLIESEVYDYAIVATSGEIRAKFEFEEKKPDTPMKLRWQSNGKMRPGKYPVFGVALATSAGSLRVTINSTGDSPNAGFKLIVVRRDPVEVASMNYLTGLRLALEAGPGRMVDTRANRAIDGGPWDLSQPVPRIVLADAPAPPAGFAGNKPAILQPYYRALYIGGEHGAVINLERLGLVALEAGHIEDATWAFDQALNRIEAIYGKSKVADAAKSTWKLEAIKDFKGEPYERVMAYYYRGLLYLYAGDYENARATFRAGEYQDTVSEAEEFKGDFGLMTFLAGWSARCAGNANAAEEDFRVAATIDPKLAAPPADRNLLLLGETGSAPVKTKRGDANQLIMFAPSMDAARDEQAMAQLSGIAAPAKGKAAKATATSKDIDLTPGADIAFQATTRGGRPIDAILDGKASVQSAFNSIAGGLAGAGDLMLLSLIPQLIGNKVRPDADIRMWDTLPDRVLFATASATPATTMAIRFTGKAGPVVATPTIAHVAGRCSLAWSRSRSATKAAPGVPGLDPKAVISRAKSPEGLQRDTAFRSWLVRQLG